MWRWQCLIYNGTVSVNVTVILRNPPTPPWKDGEMPFSQRYSKNHNLMQLINKSLKITSFSGFECSIQKSFLLFIIPIEKSITIWMKVLKLTIYLINFTKKKWVPGNLDVHGVSCVFSVEVLKSRASYFSLLFLSTMHLLELKPTTKQWLHLLSLE